MPYIQAVVPVMNEEAIIPALAERLAAALRQVSEDYGIILVDDGSRDSTWSEIQAAAERDPNLAGLRFSRNFGQHVAITAGLEAADADWVVVMDGDLQDRPEVIPELHVKAQEGYDVIFVARQERPEGLLYRLCQRAFYGTLRALTDTDYNPEHGNFSMISRRVLTAYRSLEEGVRFYGGLVSWLGFRSTTVPATHGERLGGASSYSLGKRFKLAKDIILAFSVRPLYAAICVGILSTLFSFIFGSIIIVRALLADVSVEGWASVMVSIYFVGGVIMTLVGMNGLYIGKVYSEIQRRPLYIVAETAGAGETQVIRAVGDAQVSARLSSLR